MEPGGEAPEDWYLWTAMQLGLHQQPDWSKLDRDIHRLAEWWSDDVDDDQALAERLYMAVETVHWGRHHSEIPT